MGMEFGIFDSFDLGRTEPGDVLASRLRFAQTADELGVDHYHVTEHHGTPLSVCPSPNIFLSALSQRTTRMRFGALVNVLPEHHPFRLAEEISVLDQLSGGRVDVGVGSGVSPYELAVFGVAAADAKAVYRERLVELTTALRTGRLAEHHLSVLPVQRPYPPLWYASSNTASAQWAGANAVNFVGRWNGGAITDAVRAYRDAWADHRDDPDRLNPHVTEPRVGIAAGLVIAGSDEQARDVYGRANDLFCERLTHLWHQHDDHRVDRAFATETTLANGAAWVGTADTVRDVVVHQVGTSGVNYVELSVFFGDLTPDQAGHSLRAFVDRVAPAARQACTW
ncbi:MAG TPA: LLM class flavin-dependent oxidoreductase [Pseudonocardiaceae bacterium]|nr:LLM class flavin-dependent oxidoreductase [Pseudonocardiaceae bacterium]